MHRPSRPLSAALLSCLLAGPAIAQTSMTGMAMAPSSPMDRSMQTGMAAMNRGMASAPITGDPDRDFVAMMLPHHEGAVAMARSELQYGKDPQLRRMAKAIITSQDQEIAEMHAWQAAHPAP
jgi:uncharacterized protein (DUF305 family)